MNYSAAELRSILYAPPLRGGAKERVLEIIFIRHPLPDPPPSRGRESAENPMQSIEEFF
jgi:hypothetical protein